MKIRILLVLMASVMAMFGIGCGGGGDGDSSKSGNKNPPVLLFDGFRVEGQERISDTSLAGGVVVTDATKKGSMFATGDRASLRDGMLHLEGNVSCAGFFDPTGSPTGSQTDSSTGSLTGELLVFEEGRKLKMPGSPKLILPRGDEG